MTRSARMHPDGEDCLLRNHRSPVADPSPESVSKVIQSTGRQCFFAAVLMVTVVLFFFRLDMPWRPPPGHRPGGSRSDPSLTPGPRQTGHRPAGHQPGQGHFQVLGQSAGLQGLSSTVRTNPCANQHRDPVRSSKQLHSYGSTHLYHQRCIRKQIYAWSRWQC